MGTKMNKDDVIEHILGGVQEASFKKLGFCFNLPEDLLQHYAEVLMSDDPGADDPKDGEDIVERITDDVTAETVKFAFDNCLHNDTWPEQIGEILGMNKDNVYHTIDSVPEHALKIFAKAINMGELKVLGMYLTTFFPFAYRVFNKDYEQLGHILAEWIFIRRE